MAKKNAIVQPTQQDMPMPVQQSEQQVQTLGELYDAQMTVNIESDMRFAVASRALASARARMKKIKDDCELLVRDIEASYSPEEAGLATLFIESCRPELVQIYMSINYRIAATVDGQRRIATLADGVIDGYLRRLTAYGDPLGSSDAK